MGWGEWWGWLGTIKKKLELDKGKKRAHQFRILNPPILQKTKREKKNKNQCNIKAPSLCGIAKESSVNFMNSSETQEYNAKAFFPIYRLVLNSVAPMPEK